MGAESGADVVITEIGGTTGDIESQPFLEAARQVSLEMGKKNTLFIHVTLVPFLCGSNEHKTKPTQHSVQMLQQAGVHPDIIVCRTEKDLSPELRRKVALFCNVKPGHVIQSIDAPSIYQVPLNMEDEKLDQLVLEHFGWLSRVVRGMIFWLGTLSVVAVPWLRPIASR